MKTKSKIMGDTEIKIMTDYYNNFSTNQIMVDYGVSKQDIKRIKSKYFLKVSYDKNELIERLKHDYSNLGNTSFVNKYKIQFSRYREIEEGIYITTKKLIEWLDLHNIEYSKSIERNKERKNQNHLISTKGKLEKTKRKGGSYKMAYAEIQDYKKKLAIIESQRARLADLLHEKGMSAELKTRIINLANVIARESMLVGIHSSKNGYGDKLEHAILSVIGGIL